MRCSPRRRRASSDGRSRRRRGDSPQTIVTSFIQAMNAFPVTNDVTRQFLTADEQNAWDPSRRIITYKKTQSARGTDPDTMTMRLNGGHWVDSRGAWRGRLPLRQRTLLFQMAKENGEWRIAKAPDAFIVPDNWFQDHYTPASVYYLDPTASIMVPEPVFVPTEQLATALVQSLLDGPGPRLADVSRSFVPTGLTPGLSIPIDAAGLASISLGATPSSSPRRHRSCWSTSSPGRSGRTRGSRPSRSASTTSPSPWTAGGLSSPSSSARSTTRPT